MFLLIYKYLYSILPVQGQKLVKCWLLIKLKWIYNIVTAITTIYLLAFFNGVENLKKQKSCTADFQFLVAKTLKLCKLKK